MDKILRSFNKNKNNNKILPMYDVNIDFDESSKLWNANKKKTASGLYKYVCESFTKKSDKCNRVCYKDNNNCYQHCNANIVSK